MTGRVDPTTVPECVECGCCCFSTLREYVRVSGADHARMDDRARSFTEFDGFTCAMRMVDGHCAALVIDPDARTYRCTIYPVRPDVCRSLERGSGACRADRHEKAERPLVAVERLHAARRHPRA